MAEDPLAGLLRRTGLEPGPAFADELEATLRAELAGLATPTTGEPVPARGDGPPAAMVPPTVAGEPVVTLSTTSPGGSVSSTPNTAPRSRRVLLAAAAALIVVGVAGVALALSRGVGDEGVAVDAGPATSVTTAATGPSSTTEPTAASTATTAAPGVPVPGWAAPVAVALPPGWTAVAADCPDPRTVATSANRATTAGHCDDRPGPSILIEPLPRDLDGTATTCQPAVLADGTTTCERADGATKRRLVLVDGQDVLVTATSVGDAEVDAALRSLARTAVAPASASTGAVAGGGSTAALDAAFGPIVTGGCAALTTSASDPAALQAPCAALGLASGGATVAGARFSPTTADEPGTARYVVDVTLPGGELRSAEVTIAYRWAADVRQGAWWLMAIQPR